MASKAGRYIRSRPRSVRLQPDFHGRLKRGRYVRSPPLRGARPIIIEPVTRTHDVIVIGAGIIGCAIGRELARRGSRVKIFEARAVGGGATQASAGVLAPYIEAHDREPLFALTVRSLELYDRFVQEAAAESGVVVEYRRCGTLEVATDGGAAERLKGMAAALADPELMRWLDGPAARLEEHGLAESIEGALLVPQHGYVAVAALTEALAWAALRHGAQLEAAHRVTGVRSDGQGLAVMTEDGSVWPAEQVVVAAGSWSGQIGAGDTTTVPVRPVRGQLLRLKWSGELLSRIVWGPDCYVVPWENGTVLVGATVEDVGFDERATAAGVRDLLEAACELLPDAWRASFIEARVGLRPATADGLPVIGRSEELPRMVYATGHYRNGILLAPLTAQLVAELIIDGREDPILQAVRPGR
jgi:glycine oxidase